LHISIRKCINLNLKFRKKKLPRDEDRSPVHCHFSCSQHCSIASMTPPRSGFLNRFIINPFRSNALITLVLFLQIYWTVEFMRPNPRYTLAIFFFLCLFVVSRCLFFDAQKLLLFVTVAMLSRYHSPVNCRSRKVGCNLTHKVNYPYCCHWQGWN